MKILFFGILFLVLINTQAQPTLKKENWAEVYNHKKRNFRLGKEPYVLVDTSLLSIEAVYTNSYKVAGEGRLEEITVYQFIRFFRNGRVFISGAYSSPPSEEESNNLEYGSIGYYKIENNNRLIMEFYFDRQLKYTLWYANIDKGNVSIQFIRPRRGIIVIGEKVNIVYKSTPLNLYTKPDW